MASNSTIVISGMGVVCGLAHSVTALADKLLRGGSAVNRKLARRGDVQPVVTAVAPARPPARGVSVWRLSRSTQLTLAAIQQALEQARLRSKAPWPELGIIHASTRGNVKALLDYETELQRYGPDRGSPIQFPGTILHASAGFLSVATGAAAFNLSVANGSGSGADAVELARQLILAGAARHVLCTAAEEISSEFISLLRMEDELEPVFPDPFGKDRCGYIPGEAAVAALVETKADAARRRVKPLAVYRGYSNTAIGQRSNLSGDQNVLAVALQAAGVAPAELGCVFASANGSKHDGGEAEALASVCGRSVPVTSIKAAVGECGAASALLNLAALVGCSRRAICPPTLGRSRYDPALPPLRLLREPDRLRKPVAAINTFDPAVAHSCLVLQIA